MNILFVYERKIISNFGGVERVTLLLSGELQKRGHNIIFLSVGPHEWNETKTEDQGFEQIYMPLSMPAFKEKYDKLIDDYKISIVFFQGIHPTVLETLDLTGSMVKKIVTLHMNPYSISPFEKYIKRITPWRSLTFKGKLYKLLALSSPGSFRKINNRRIELKFNKIMESADKFVVLSEKFVSRILQFSPKLNRGKLGAINNPNTFIPTDNDESNEKKNIVLFVGRLSNPQKNVTGFIDVWKEFSVNNPGWEAIVVGDGEDREYIIKYAGRKKVERLSFEGNRKNIEDYYKQSKILCMTSTYEGWGMVLPEAMAYGCVPVAYNSFDSITDIIDSGENGILIKPFDIEEMAAALGLLASDENMRKAMAASGKEKINQFNVNKIVDQWEILFNSL